MTMALRLSVRSGIRLFDLSNKRCYSATTGPSAEVGGTVKELEPLRILFCGSDKFSCASLLALHKEHSENADLIQSIDVVARPGKPKGRGLKQIVYPDIHHEAAKHNLPIHSRDTFTGWSPPAYINLIIAVSFGLFVPPRILNAARYGGLNLHPSLLPDFRGAAPLQHTLLARRPFTGVTLQTLHPEHFDRGVILSQVPSLSQHSSDGIVSKYLASERDCPLPKGGIPIPPSCTADDLRDLLAPIAADLLITGLRRGLHVPPLEDRSWWRQQHPPNLPTSVSQQQQQQQQPLHAPKILPSMRQITPEDIVDNSSTTTNTATTDNNNNNNKTPSWKSLRHLPLRWRALGPPWLYLIEQQQRSSGRSKKTGRGGQRGSHDGNTSASSSSDNAPEQAEKKEAKVTTTTTRVIFTEIVETLTTTNSTPGDDEEFKEFILPFSASSSSSSSSSSPSSVQVEEEEGKLRCRVRVSSTASNNNNDDQGVYFPYGGFKVTKVKVEGKTERPAREALERFFMTSPAAAAVLTR